MTPPISIRDWFVFALRVIGFWAALGAIRESTQLARGILLIGNGPMMMYAYDLLVHGFGTLTYGVFGACLILQAPWIASKFYSRDALQHDNHGNGVTVSGAYQIGLHLLGIYAWMYALAPLTQAVFIMNTSDPRVRQQVYYLLCEAGAFGMSGALLLWLAPLIARFLSSRSDNR